MNHKSPTPPAESPTLDVIGSEQSRRGFLTKFLAVVVGGIVTLFPFMTGLAVFLDPLRLRKKRNGDEADTDGFLKIAALDALLVNTPRRFTVIDDRSDAWNLYPQEPIGAVYLLRTAGNQVRALNVLCPHAGCSVDYKRDHKLYQCPCHNSSFELDGELANRSSPSPRGLDALEVKIKNGTEIWIKFQNFRSSTKEKIAEV